METDNRLTRGTVAVVYHFFADYRAGILSELIRRGRFKYQFFADCEEYHFVGIKSWDIPETVPFERKPCHKLAGHWMWQRGIIRLAFRTDIDTFIFFGNAYWPSTWIALLICRLLGKRVLIWTHGWLRPERGFVAIWRRTFYRLAHGLLLYGHHAKQLGIQSGFDPHRLYVVYNSHKYDEQKVYRESVSREEIIAVRERLFSNSETPVAICTTRVYPKRRLDLLIAAVAQLAQQQHDVNVLIVGEGPELPDLRRQAAQLNVTVCFFEACYDERTLAGLFMASNVTVAPGMVGLAAIQSLAYGVPVVTHNDMNAQTPEAEAVIQGHNGSLFEPGT